MSSTPHPELTRHGSVVLSCQFSLEVKVWVKGLELHEVEVS